jgi:hypothetical protein
VVGGQKDLVSIVVDAVTQREVNAIVFATLGSNILAVARAREVLAILVKGDLSPAHRRHTVLSKAALHPTPYTLHLA